LTDYFTPYNPSDSIKYLSLWHETYRFQIFDIITQAPVDSRV